MTSAPSDTTYSNTPSSVCHHCGTNTGPERVDATKLNSLLDRITARLSSDAHGNFYVKGGTLSNDKRHGQLGEVFSLVSQLQTLKGTMDKYIALHQPKAEAVDVSEAPKVVKVSENMTSAIEGIVEVKMAGALRDLSIRCGRVEEAVEKMKAANGQDARKLRALQKKFSTAVEVIEVPSENDIAVADLRSTVQALSAVLDKLNSRLTHMDTLSTTCDDHETRLTSVEMLSNARNTAHRRGGRGEVTISGLEARVDRLDEREEAAYDAFVDLKANMHQETEAAHYEVANAKARIEGVEGRVTEMEGAQYQVSDAKLRIEDIDGRVKELEHEFFD